MPPKNLKKGLENLLQTINIFITKYNPSIESHKAYSERYKKLTEFHALLSKEIKSLEIVHQTLEINNCVIKSIKIIKPNKSNGYARTPFTKTTVLLNIEVDTPDCIFAETKAKIDFIKVVNNSLSESNLLSSSEIPLENITQNENIISTKLIIDFSSNSNDTIGVIIKIGNIKSEYILYNKSQVDLSTSEKAKTTINNYKSWTEKFYLNSGINTNTIQSICPALNIIEGKYVKMTEFKAELEKNQYIKDAEANSFDFEKLSINDLEILYNKYQSLSTNLQLVIKEFEYDSNILDDLEEQYEGKDANVLFDAAYKKQVQANNSILVFIKTKQILLETYANDIKNEILDKAIPKDLVSQATTLNNLKAQQEPVFSKLEEDSRSYRDGELTLDTFQKWKSMLDNVDKECVKLQQEWDVLWTPFDKATTDYTATDKYFTEWKTLIYEELKSYSLRIQNYIKNIKDYLADFQATITQTGGDGRLEFKVNENLLSTDETKKFDTNPKLKTTFSFDDTTLPLVNDSGDGFAADDIKQGEVGDCYLMAALISLTKDNKDLIKSMITTSGDKYIVTLYKDDIPIEVEVDKNLLIKHTEGYTDVMPAAQAIDDIWVPIIEKAYAKLFGSTPTDSGGDLTKIEGGNSANALKALLGNKVKKPSEIYLDATGIIVNQKSATTIQNPIKLTNITEVDLALVIQAATNAKYEIHVSSPNNYNGIKLSDHDIIPIDNSNNYMSFKHEYSLIKATKTDVTIRNPHGDTNQDQSVFSDDVKLNISDLMTAIDNLEQDLLSRSKIDDKLKVAMDNAINNVSKNALISFRFKNIISDWEKCKEKKITKNSSDWIADSKFEKKLKNHIQNLKKDINDVANTKDKANFLKDGFLTRVVALKAEQTITYSVLKKYFETITISIIS